jgi:putative oxidoreductase
MTDHRGGSQEVRPGLAWAVLFARTVLGLIFFMAGVYKVFQQGPAGHVRQLFLPYSDTFLPVWSLWVVGYTIPFIELVGGVLVLIGWRTRLALVSLGCVLVVVTFGHLLKQPLYALHEHVIPRLVLLLFVLAVPREADRFSLDAVLAWRGDAA